MRTFAERSAGGVVLVAQNVDDDIDEAISFADVGTDCRISDDATLTPGKYLSENPFSFVPHIRGVGEQLITFCSFIKGGKVREDIARRADDMIPAHNGGVNHNTDQNRN